MFKRRKKYQIQNRGKKGNHGYRRLKRGSGKRLQVGVIESIDEANDTITVIAKGGSVTLSPMDKILFVQPSFKIPKDLKK